MNLANDFRIAPGGHGESLAAQAAGSAAPEWRGLYARLSAAHALRREMSGSDSPALRLCGSFSDWTLPDCAEPDGKQVVNLKDLTDRKVPRSIGAGIAGQVHAGDREL